MFDAIVDHDDPDPTNERVQTLLNQVEDEWDRIVEQIAEGDTVHVSGEVDGWEIVVQMWESDECGDGEIEVTTTAMAPTN